MTDQQIIELVAGWTYVGITAKEVGKRCGVTTAKARRVLDRLAREGKVVNTGFVQIARDGGSDIERAVNIKKVPGGSLLYVIPEFVDP